MSRKSIIVFIAVLIAMIVGVGIAVVVLYSGTEGGLFKREKTIPQNESYLLLPAVPVDAVFVACLSESELADSLSCRAIGREASTRMSISLHFKGHLQALYVFDAGKASPVPSEKASGILSAAKDLGLFAEYVDCSAISGDRRDISKRSVIIAAESEALLKSSLRHLQESYSIINAPGFVGAASAVSAKDVLFFPNSQARTLMRGMFSRRYSSYHPFVATLGKWTVAEITKADGSEFRMSVKPVCNGEPSEFISVLEASGPGKSSLPEILPSYTVSAVSIPLKDLESYVESHDAYLDSRHLLKNTLAARNEFKRPTAVDYLKRLDIKEVAKASFVVRGKVEEVNLIKTGRKDTVIFRGTDVESFRNNKPVAREYKFGSCLSSVFGTYFNLESESHFTYIDGWIVSGSKAAVEEYASGHTLSYTLEEYLADAGSGDLIQGTGYMNVYHSFTEYPSGDSRMFSSRFGNFLAPFHSGCDYCPLIIAAVDGRDGIELKVRIPKLEMKKTRAPEFVRDTTVTVPQGPFRIETDTSPKIFYQNSYNSLCLKEEGGRDLWGAPFKGKLCGTASAIDFYDNGKTQIIFGSGSSIYVMDLRGHFVGGSPFDLKKEILLGPAIYSFGGEYRLMVLHKDDSLEMYSSRGEKIPSWKGISAPETIKSLPESIKVGDRNYWVVRTAIQTLIYPFDGGAPLTSFKENQKIRPDSDVEIKDGTSVNVRCYDGKTRTVNLK